MFLFLYYFIFIFVYFNIILFMFFNFYIFLPSYLYIFWSLDLFIFFYSFLICFSFFSLHCNFYIFISSYFYILISLYFLSWYFLFYPLVFYAQTLYTHAGHPFLHGHVISHERISIGQAEAYCNISVEESFWGKELGKMSFCFRFWRSNLIRGKKWRFVPCRGIAPQGLTGSGAKSGQIK